MLDNPTLEKMNAMRLTGMAEAWCEQMDDTEISQLSFEERLALLVDRQWIWRENRALQRRLKNARLKQGTLEDIDYRHPRGLDRSVMRSLAASEWVARHRNVILPGPCGVGKTFLACALAQKAVRDRFTALYTRAPRLFRDLAMASMLDSERRDFLEICEDRWETRSTILTSQIPIAHWHEQIGDPTLADSILDRLVHNAYRIELKGASMRKLKTGGQDSGPRDKQESD